MNKYCFLKGVLINLILLLTFKAHSSTNLTFTAHPTNTNLGERMYKGQSEIDYYYNNKLNNIAYILLHDGNNLLQDIGKFYSWIGYDFDRSNLSYKDIIFANIEGIKMMSMLYADYINQHINNDIKLSETLARVDNYIHDVTTLIKHENLSFDNFIKDFNRIAQKADFPALEKHFKNRLEQLNQPQAKILLEYFNQFRFQLCSGQIRFSGQDLLEGKDNSEIFKTISSINKVQNYAISDIIIANFSNLEEINIIKKLKRTYNISNISTIPLLESEVDVDYAIKNLAKIIKLDNISQIMKAGSDDTKFSGMASSILNFAKLGYAIQNLNTKNKPIFFIGMGTSIERSGGPLFYRKMLAQIIGNNTTNRTIQGGELEAFSTKDSTISKLKNEVAISQVKSTINIKDIESFLNLSNTLIIKKYQLLYNDQQQRNSLNSLIKDTNLGFILDNFQAGSRYKRKMLLNHNGELINSFKDLFDDTRAIDFQTTFALSGLHPEFIVFKDINNEQINSICAMSQNSILDTYISAMLILQKQTNTKFYKALNLSKHNNLYQSFISGVNNFTKLTNKCFPNLNKQINENLLHEHYLDYSAKTENNIIQYLSMQKIIVKQYKDHLISFDCLKEKLFELNYKIAKARNLLHLGIKN